MIQSNIKKIALYLNHPSQHYFFKNFIELLSKNSFIIKIYIKEKDILEELLIKANYNYKLIYRNKKTNGIFALIKNVFSKNKVFLKELKIFKPDIIITCGSDVAQVGFILGIPTVVFNDDDAKVVKFSAIFGWPFASVIIAPVSCNMGRWKEKTITYKGYQKLAYLHPKYFKADKNILSKYGLENSKYFIIRSVSLTAHHDKNKRGLNNKIVEQLINILLPYGNVYISSERELPKELQKYVLKINPLDIHTIIFFSSLLIGDSQSMAHEAAILGTPSIRFNDFVGRIGVLEELENTYGLTFGISPDKPEQLFQKVIEMIKSDKNIFHKKASKMMNEMIDLPAFMVWFIENYPESKKIMKTNPDYKFNFK